MREIKFRAWYQREDRPEDNQMLFVGDSTGTSHPLDCCRYSMEGQPVILMQYTGIKDKNDAEIYEGDIVRGCGKNVGHSHVFFDYGQWQPFSYLGTFCGGEYEIIGNIYENPELLQEAKQ